MDTQNTNGQVMTDDTGKPLTTVPVSLPHLSVQGNMLDGFMYLLQQMKDGKLPESQTPTTQTPQPITNNESAFDRLEQALTDALSAVRELKASQAPDSSQQPEPAVEEPAEIETPEITPEEPEETPVPQSAPEEETQTEEEEKAEELEAQRAEQVEAQQAKELEEKLTEEARAKAREELLGVQPTTNNQSLTTNIPTEHAIPDVPPDIPPVVPPTTDNQSPTTNVVPPAVPPISNLQSPIPNTPPVTLNSQGLPNK